MTACTRFSGEGSVNIADALRSIDCLSGQAVEIAFARLFGASGALGQALTIVLTLYIALFALGLLTGRSGLRINVMTPRMLQLGVVLTFATSWVAYQNVGWNLLTGAPDQVASIVLGTKGSATQIFARRLDVMFDIIASSAKQTAVAAPPTTGAAPAPPLVSNGAPKPATLLWAASLLLLLGSVGVLVVARIGLAALMALGPVFIVLALFDGTRGLFEGWLKAAVNLALAPMFAVLLGGGTMVVIAPMIGALEQAGANVTLEMAASILLAAFVHVALMVLAMRAASMITQGWRPTGTRRARADEAAPQASTGRTDFAAPHTPPPGQIALAGAAGDRMRSIVSAMRDGSLPDGLAAAGSAAGKDARRTMVVARVEASGDSSGARIGPDPRIRPLGQGFRAPTRKQVSR